MTASGPWYQLLPTGKDTWWNTTSFNIIFKIWITLWFLIKGTYNKYGGTYNKDLVGFAYNCAIKAGPDIESFLWCIYHGLQMPDISIKLDKF